MKRIKNILISITALLCTGGVVSAQNSYLGGLTVSAFDFGPMDMLSLSQHNSAFTTARATAMGGAFASLGGDLASMSINPAGIAMYRSTVFGISPTMNFSGTDNPYSPGTMNSSRFSMNNIGIVVETFRSSRTVTNVNLGFSYNKLMDYNYSYKMDMPAGAHSLADIMSFQLNGLHPFLAGDGWDGIPQSWLKNDPFGDTRIGLAEWGAVLGYNTKLVTSMNPANDAWKLYGSDGIDPRYAKILPSMHVENRGSVGEYNFSFGMNIQNKLYLGLGITAQSLFMSKGLSYSEEYQNNNGDNPATLYLRKMYYDQSVRMSGAGLNFKLGAVYRPIPNLRIGLAVHTPTWTSITHEYNGSMETVFQLGSGNKQSQTPLNYWDWDYNGPTRLMAGVSYTFGNYAALAVDYERVWYNGMRVTSGDYGMQEGYKREITDLYKPGNNIKVGLEIKPTPVFSLRAGYSFYGSPLNFRDEAYSKVVLDETQNLSAGIGFRLGRSTMLDFAYVYSMNKFAKFDLFYYEGQILTGNGDIVYTDTNNPITTYESPVSDLKLNRHSVTMTLGFVF